MESPSSHHRIHTPSRPTIGHGLLRRAAVEPLHVVARGYRLLDSRSRNCEPQEAHRCLRSRVGAASHRTPCRGNGDAPQLSLSDDNHICHFCEQTVLSDHFITDAEYVGHFA